MERNVNFVYIGGLFLALIVLMVGFVMWLGGGNLNKDQYYSYIVYSRDGISGVGVGTTVRYKGLLVGRVASIGFKKGDMNFIELKLNIDSNIILKKNACVSTASQGLAGSTFLDLIQGNGDEILHNGAELCYQKGFIGKLFDDVEQSSGEVKEIIAELRKMFNDTNGRNIQELIEAVKIITQNLEETRKNIDELSVLVKDTVRQVNTNIKRGDYNIRSIISPTLVGMENSLLQINHFFSKANLLLDRLEKSPYDTLFGQRVQRQEGNHQGGTR